MQRHLQTVKDHKYVFIKYIGFNVSSYNALLNRYIVQTAICDSLSDSLENNDTLFNLIHILCHKDLHMALLLESVIINVDVTLFC